MINIGIDTGCIVNYHEKKLIRGFLGPRVCNGRPIIRSTRIPVLVILDQIVENDSWGHLLFGCLELKKGGYSGRINLYWGSVLITRRIERSIPEPLSLYLGQVSPFFINI